VLTVEDWAEIRRLHRAERMPIKVIARTVGCAKNTVWAAIRSDGPPWYQRAPRGSLVDQAEPRIRELLKACPTMPATVVAERIGWEHSIRILRDRVSELRPAYLPPDPSSRTTYGPGELAQFDFWFPPIELPVGFGQTRTAKRLPVMTMVSGYSRTAGGLLIPSRETEDLFPGWWQLLQQLGAVPRLLVWDGEGAVGRYRPRQSLLTGDCRAFRGVLGVNVYVCKPADPEAKGMLERFHDYLETSFLPGRSFTGPADFNHQLAGFVLRANARRMRVLGCAPNDRVAADRAAMLPLPPVSPEVGWRKSLRLPRDHYVRLDCNDYSVHPGVIGRRIDVHADLDRVWVTCQGAIVADHARVWARHQTLTDLEHSVAAKLLRHGRADLLRPVPDAVTGEEIEIRSLGVYDTILGLVPEPDEQVG
jgi:transposase